MKTLALAAVAALLLAGCSSGGGDGDKSSTSTTSASRSSTAPSGPGAITVELTRSTPNGAVPLAVNLTLDAAFRSAAGINRSTPPPGATWSITVFSDGNRTDGPSGTSLPANVTLDLTEPGNHTVTATVSAPGYTPANDTVLVQAVAAGPGVPLFFDGGEGDASQWTVTSNVWIYEIFTGTEEELDEEHPDGTWQQSTDEARSGTKSWSSQYPDNYRTRMQSVPIQVPAGGASLSYWVKGGAEGNGVDGLHVLLNDVELALHNNVPEWTQFTFPVPAGEATLLFRFDSDMGCSDQSPGPAGDPSGSICGAGYDLGGIHLDDVTVA